MTSSDGKFYARLRGAGRERTTVEITPPPNSDVPTMAEVLTALIEKVNAI
jgi:hypothetical protein